MLLVYYNLNTGVFFLKYVKHCFTSDNRYCVGYTNQFNHILVQMFVYDNCLIECNSYIEYLQDYVKKINEDSVKDKLINRVIDLLNRLKNKKED